MQKPPHSPSSPLSLHLILTSLPLCSPLPLCPPSLSSPPSSPLLPLPLPFSLSLSPLSPASLSSFTPPSSPLLPLPPPPLPSHLPYSLLTVTCIVVGVWPFSIATHRAVGGGTSGNSSEETGALCACIITSVWFESSYWTSCEMNNKTLKLLYCIAACATGKIVMHVSAEYPYETATT